MTIERSVSNETMDRLHKRVRNDSDYLELMSTINESKSLDDVLSKLLGYWEEQHKED